MLTPARAQTILSYILTLMAVLTALGLCFFLLNMRLPATYSLTVPLDITLSLPGGRYEISNFHLPLSDLPEWARNVWLSGFTLFIACLIALLWGARQFTCRLLRDPFHPHNVRDLTVSARLALIWHVLAVVQPTLNGWVTARSHPLEALRRQLPEDAVISGREAVLTTSFSILGVDLTPLLIAAVCVLFAAALTQAAHIREQERQLRAEQELTV